MLYSVGSPLPEYRVRAFNDSANSRNRIQDDEYARRHGFRAGLVPGVCIFAYMTRSLIEFMGRSWLERGSADVRFVRPVYEGEEIRIMGSVSSISEDGMLSLDCRASNNKGVTCGIGVAQLPPQAPAHEPSLGDYPPGHAKLHRPISLESLAIGECLMPHTSEFTWNVHWQYCQKSIRDHYSLYQKVLHPGWIVAQATQILAENYAIPAWIDVSGRVQNYHLQEEECIVETRGRVQDKFESNGDHFIVLDLAVFAEARCLETIHYTAIFRIAPNAA
jgi:acyl dehydratase